jgi:hypothetical protein
MQTDTDKSGQPRPHTAEISADLSAKNSDPAAFPSEDAARNPVLSPLAARIIALLNFYTRQTIRDLSHAHRIGASRSAIKSQLRLLIRAGYARQHGKGRSTWYTR